MTKVNYDIGLSLEPFSKRIFVNIIFDERYVLQKAGKQHLSVPGQLDSYWEWLASFLHIKPLSLRHQSLTTRSEAKLYIARPCFNDKILLSNDLYIKYTQQLFASFRSGLSMAEMVLKTQDRFIGDDWADSPDTTLEPHSESAVLTCKIEPIHATVQSIFPPYELNRKKRLDVTTWKPKDPTHYAVVWHLLITLSNGEKYKMYLPISSLSEWQTRTSQYFEANPMEVVSPNVLCRVTNHPQAYCYEKVMERLQFYQDSTNGMTPTEILIKLSTFLYYPDRTTHLQKILTGNGIELVFSGNVHWD